MSCQHQKRIWQRQYACSDGEGVFVSREQCFSRGRHSGSKCLFVTYEDSEGKPQGACGPCEVTGSGMWGCPMVGAEGPVNGSKVLSCQSQCDDPCGGAPGCAEAGDDAAPTQDGVPTTI